jgi:ATP/maltotriose-dependent transcriptional regulator MalT/DNA-binding SARP family transcriptional activator
VTDRSSALAKLTRPKLYDVLPRPRLFALLDEAATRPIVWVCAPPGSGKTTLLASYLEARAVRHLWFQIDVGDADAATFVHYMRSAALQVAGRAAASLPLFTSGTPQDQVRFARGFFRDLFSVLPHPCAIVLDNFHEAPARPEQRVALAAGFDEIPEGITVFVVARTDPPPEFARLEASGRIARFDATELRCTPQEAEAIIGRRRAGGSALGEQLLQRIHEQSDGWVAALVLLREHLSRKDAAIDQSLGAGKEAIFRYFAGEIFSRAPAENRRVLMLTALAPSITADEAVALTGHDAAPRLLEYLYRRRLFTDRRHGARTSYHYHALFREFLLDELRKRMTPAEQRAAGARAAALIAERGLIGDALTLYRDAGRWAAMRTLICAHALDWARQGRAQALTDWIEALPADLRATDPWLDYWLGRAWIFIVPQRGRPALERAYAAFRESGDLRGQALALGAIVTGYYYEWANFGPLDRWLPEFDRLLGAAGAAALDRESELRVRAAWLIALLFRRPDDENLQRCAARLDQLIDGEDDVNVRLMAASTLFNYYNWTTKSDSAAALVARIAPLAAVPEATPMMQVWWRTHLSFWHYLNGRYEDSAAAASAARAIAERYGLEAHLFEIDHADAAALISKGDHAAAQASLAAIERRLSPSRRMDWAYFHRLRSMLAQRQGQFAAAVLEAERALALAHDTGIPLLQMPHFLARVAHSRSASGDRDGGLRVFDEAIAQARGADRVSFEQQRELLQIDLDIDAGETQRARTRLAAVLADYREQGRFVFLRNRPDLAARLADFALAQDIETEFVRTLIERNALAPPAQAAPAWPFRLRIHALGGFALLRDGQPLRFSGKAQQRPLDLLKLLVALGGREVDSQQLTAALWPDADGAAAKTSFDTTLFRLRKLLDVDAALALTGGKLSLARAAAWTDVWALEAALEASLDAADRSDAAAAAHAARRLLALYAGSLLGAEENAWIARPRDALRARFVRALIRLGETLERYGDWTTAIDVYRRGLEADNLAEPFYRGLMRALAATGAQAEALNTFRRCGELLSIVLGVQPSAETETLYREIAAAEASHRAFNK